MDRIWKRVAGGMKYYSESNGSEKEWPLAIQDFGLMVTEGMYALLVTDRSGANAKVGIRHKEGPNDESVFYILHSTPIAVATLASIPLLQRGQTSGGPLLPYFQSIIVVGSTDANQQWVVCDLYVGGKGEGSAIAATLRAAEARTCYEAGGKFYGSFEDKGLVYDGLAGRLMDGSLIALARSASRLLMSSGTSSSLILPNGDTPTVGQMAEQLAFWDERDAEDSLSRRKCPYVRVQALDDHAQGDVETEFKNYHAVLALEAAADASSSDVYYFQSPGSDPAAYAALADPTDYADPSYPTFANFADGTEAAPRAYAIVDCVRWADGQSF